jgi:6-pyruvoyl-tetrahydropterin synthase
MEQKSVEIIASELMGEFDEHRKAIKSMIADLERIKAKIDRVIPDTLDARYIRFFEEKVKSVTNLFNSLLEMRKEITKSVREELELRNKISGSKDRTQELEDLLDIRQMAEKVEDFRSNKLKLLKKLDVEEDKIEIPEGVKIPGINIGIIS